ncbi:hypothetical protein LZS94_18105 [Aliivibrio fischeri]|uniref:Uncharacterized protein n=1 Tax=Aliivibrio sifiae TaxID=566293 RepID=A0A2S7X2N6_9GAMM|nr:MULTISPECIES: hypothetical protein [Aliivibrio]MCE7579432.1 hypothetical protein [Aliivibrio fischeri]MCE7591736.1 hypothetical protein [Aliivibrio fischeri]OCH57052.1 hypothetical protein A6D98_19755 [Aliivibrio fischeri]PQJ84453.1 hypothetical protein BTO22_13040 [Aliivibrio sifiae]
MNNNERTIQFYDLDICGKTLARDIPHTMASPRTLDELMAEFSSLRELGLARKKISMTSDLEFRLEDMEEKEDSWVLLINVVDTQAAHPVTQKVGGSVDDREVVVLSEERGLESSCHIIILKAQNAAHKHLTLIEKNTNLPALKACSFLNHMCKLAKQQFPETYTQPHPSGAANKTINVFCVLNILAHPSDEFRDELENGKINGISITSEMTVVRGYDSNTHHELIGTDIKMRVRKRDIILNGGNWGHLQKAIQHADSLDSPFVKISFNDVTGTGHTAVLSTDTGTLCYADKYVKKRKIIGFSNALMTSFPIIHTGIIDKMEELII